jgi:ABC-2 type transport system permease protein
MIRLAWRLQWGGLIGMTGFGLFYGLVQAAAYNAIAGSTAASRAAFGQQMETAGRQFSLFLPLPHGVETVAGFIQWRIYGALPLLFCFWALLSAAGANRGDEERGLLEEWLAAGVGRTRYVVTRFLTFALTATIAIGLTSAAIDLGVVGAAGSWLPFDALIEVSVALLALTLTVYAISMVLAQFAASRGAAAGLAGLVVGAIYIVNALSRDTESLVPVARLVSPFYAYDLSQPLSPGGSFNLPATLVLFAASLLLLALSVWLIRLRDIGSPAIRRRQRERPATYLPSPNPILRLPILALVYEQRWGILGWGIGCGFFAFYLASIGRQMLDLIRGSSGFRAYLTLIGHGNPYVALTGFLWFGIFLALLAVFAVTQVARWSADDNEGRLEMLLSSPVSRSRVVFERAAAFTLRMAGVIAITSLAFLLGAASAGIAIDAGSLTLASLVLIPFGLSFAAIGAVLASRAPRAAVGALTAYAFVSYISSELGPLLKWPDWALRLSVFKLYGTPLTSGVDWTGLWIMVAVTVIGFGLATVLMQRRDVAA